MFPSLQKYALLCHPFYQDWQAGKLTLPTLQCYAQQYLHHVNAFPCYLSKLHSQSANLGQRRVILENLMDEEGMSETPAHPILWENFAKGLGLSEAELNVSPLPQTQALLKTFDGLASEGFASGLGALYAYERQIPEIAKTKISGLKTLYHITAPEALEFYEVHQKADEWHSEAVENLIASLPPAEQKKAEAGALQAAEALWNFLSGIDEASHSPALAVSH